MSGSNFVGPILTAQRSLKIAGDNLSIVNVNGGKGPQQEFRTLVAGTGNVEVNKRSAIDTRGNVRFTQKEGDFSVSNVKGSMYGFLPVALNKESKEVLMSATGSFELDKDGILTETSSGKVLLAAKSSDAQIAPDFSNLEPVFIDRTAVLDAVATTKVDARAFLYSNEMISGNAQAILSVKGKALNIINPGSVKSGSSFNVITNAKNAIGEYSSSLSQYTLGGFLKSSQLNPTDPALIAGRELNITSGSNNIKVTIPSGLINMDASLSYLKNQINASPYFEADVLAEDISPGVKAVSLIVIPKDINADLSISGDLVTDLVFSNTIAPEAEKGEKRFMKMQQLYDLLKANGGAFSEIEMSNQAGATVNSTVLLLRTIPTSSVMMTNSSKDSDKNILGLLGISGDEVGTLMPSYTPLASGNNSMANGDVKPSSSTGATVHDAQGNRRQIYMAAKKIGDNMWGVELYYPQDNIKDNNVIAQAGIMRFDGNGKMIDILPVVIPLISKEIGDLSADLNATAGAVSGDTLTISVNGVSQDFIYKDPGATIPIATCYDLISEIKRSGLPVKVNIIKDGGMNKLQFVSTTPGVEVSVSGALADPAKMNIVPESTEKISVLGQGDVTFNWSTSDAVSPSTIQVNFIPESVMQQNYEYNLQLLEKDGMSPGAFQSWSTSEDGVISARFSNGATKTLYQTPVISVIAPQHLIEKASDMYAPSIDSGDIQYFIPGTSGAPKLLPQSLEGSNIESIREMTQIIDTGQWNAMLTAGFQVNNSMINDIIAAAKR